MEEVDWAKKPRAGSRVAEFVEMGTEIFLLQRVRKPNPYGIWLLSMAMHWGLYLGVGLLGLLVIGSFGAIPAFAILTNVLGIVACALGTMGAFGLAIKRATDRNLNLYTAPIDYFNLLLIAAIFVLGLASWAVTGSFAPHQAYIGSVLALKPTALPLLISLTFLLFELFMIYMPFSKLIHYFAKYFTYHSQLCDDAFKTKGSPTDKKLRNNWHTPPRGLHRTSFQANRGWSKHRTRVSKAKRNERAENCSLDRYRARVTNHSSRSSATT